MAWMLPLLPIALGGLLWPAGERLTEPDARSRRVALGIVAVLGLLTVLALAIWMAWQRPTTMVPWGAGLVLELRVTPMVGVAAVVIPVVATPVVAWAAAHEQARGLPRLLGLLVAFVGAMELLVLAADLLTLSIAWELVSALSWALVGHRWREREATGAAGYAFVATRLGGLGLWIAAGATVAVTGTLGFDALPQVARTPWGHAMAAGILLAAAAKSAQGPFAPWLFRAMAGPSSVSALLHSSTMVAAGAWLLVRLHEPLGLVPWLGPAALGLGLATALAGGIVALVQPHAKRVLAASTSAQYGLVLAAVGSGFAGAGAAHLVTHAVAKALLFLVAGTAITAAGSARLGDMRLGRRLPWVAAASAVGALALAAVPPLGMAWSKEQIVAATEGFAEWLALVTIVAGALSAAYAIRFQRLAYGPPGQDTPQSEPPRELGPVELGPVERAAILTLALLTLGLGVAWVPGLEARVRALLPATAPEPAAWLLVTSIASVVLVVVAVWVADRRGALQPASSPSRGQALAADWLGLPALLRVLVITPTCRLAAAVSRFDQRTGSAFVRGLAGLARGVSTRGVEPIERALERAVQGLARGGLGSAASTTDRALERAVQGLARGTLGMADGVRRADDRGLDAAVRAGAAGIGVIGSASRRLQSGAIPTYYSIVAGGVLVVMLALTLAT